MTFFTLTLANYAKWKVRDDILANSRIMPLPPKSAVPGFFHSINLLVVAAMNELANVTRRKKKTEYLTLQL